MHVPAFLRERPAWAVHAVVDLARDWIGRFIAVQGIDRAMAIGAQAYTALIPLMIVYASLLPRSGNESFADVLVDRFELTGSTAASVELAFAPAGEVESGVTLLGAGLLLVAALSFTRGMQRLYEGAFGLTKLGMRNTPRGLLWLVVLTVAASVRPVITEPFEGVTRVVITIAEGVVLWLVTPSLLLGRARALAPAARRRGADRRRDDRRGHLVGDLDATHDRDLRQAVRRDRHRLRDADVAGRGLDRARRGHDRRRR